MVYLSELSLSKRSRELFDDAPGDEPNRVSLPPFADSDSELWESNLEKYKTQKQKRIDFLVDEHIETAISR